ncbi:hypothetical protein ACQ9ZG_14830 [Streptomyces araujoniae]
MEPEAAKKLSVTSSPRSALDPSRPWPWVSYHDPAWYATPWEVASDEDLADAAVRLAIRYLLSQTGPNVKICRSAALVEAAAKRVMADVVAEARTQRYSWGRIGEQLGVPRTAAQKRFGGAPTAERAQTLEDQYTRMRDFVKSAELHPEMYGDLDEDEDGYELRATRDRCVRRRRGQTIDPLDQLHKVLPRRRRETGAPKE